MHVPAHFRQPDPEKVRSLIRERPLATVVTQTGRGVDANHVPLLYAPEPAPFGTLRGHVARANPMWKDAVPGAEVLAVFHGPEHYVTPSWYATKTVTGRVVPTWNYVVVHARGRLAVIDDAAWLRRHLEASTAQYEARFAEPWRLADAPADYTEQLLAAIVGIEIVLTGLDGKWKVSQNHPADNRAGVVAGLRSLGEPAGDAMAALVEGDA